MPLFLAMLIWGWFGSPCPAHLGPAENLVPLPFLRSLQFHCPPQTTSHCLKSPVPSPQAVCPHSPVPTAPLPLAQASPLFLPCLYRLARAAFAFPAARRDCSFVCFTHRHSVPGRDQAPKAFGRISEPGAEHSLSLPPARVINSPPRAFLLL